MHSSSLPNLISALSEIEQPTPTSIATILSSFSPPPSSSSENSSKATPDGHTPIVGATRDFLDRTFSLSSVNEIHSALTKAAEDSTVPQDVRAWATKQKSMMEERSPTGMALALASHRKAKKQQRLEAALNNGESSNIRLGASC